MNQFPLVMKVVVVVVNGRWYKVEVMAIQTKTPARYTMRPQQEMDRSEVEQSQYMRINKL
jgi:hypothetical protein